MQYLQKKILFYSRSVSLDNSANAKRLSKPTSGAKADDVLSCRNSKNPVEAKVTEVIDVVDSDETVSDLEDKVDDTLDSEKSERYAHSFFLKFYWYYP